MDKYLAIKVFSAFLLALVLLFQSIFMLTFDASFYHSQFSENNAYQKFGKNETSEALNSVLNTIRTGEDLSPFFNEKENRHMKDVYSLFSMLRILFLACSLLLLLIVFLLFFMNPALFLIRISDIISFSSGFLLIFLFIGLLSSLDFSGFWTSFHKLLFSNNLWLLNPAKDNMILLFPQSFFKSFFLALGKIILLRAIALGATGLSIRYIKKKTDSFSS